VAPHAHSNPLHHGRGGLPQTPNSKVIESGGQALLGARVAWPDASGCTGTRGSAMQAAVAVDCHCRRRPPAAAADPALHSLLQASGCRGPPQGAP
jgi:hypothetical protein